MGNTTIKIQYVIRDKDGDRLYYKNESEKTDSIDCAARFDSRQEAIKILGKAELTGDIEYVEIGGVENGEELFYVRFNFESIHPPKIQPPVVERVVVTKQNPWTIKTTGRYSFNKPNFSYRTHYEEYLARTQEEVDELLKLYRFKVLSDQVASVPVANESFWQKLENLLKSEGLA